MGDDERTTDRTGWGEGPWCAEPDWWQGVDRDTGLVVFAERKPEIGIWCGYACLPPGHPARAWDAGRLAGLVAHGGVTYVGHADRDLGPRVADPPGDFLLVGFDTAHGGDYWPGTVAILRRLGHDPGPTFGRTTYRTLDYVRAMLDVLCHQLGPSQPDVARVEEDGAAV